MATAVQFGKSQRCAAIESILVMRAAGIGGVRYFINL
jgi:hypothetical protein